MWAVAAELDGCSGGHTATLAANPGVIDEAWFVFFM
jgi:hypothetical protein